ncbi:MAG: hypothetical protein DI572_11525 [Staphylococcus epidermidis]|nr:MAG: hypothetical protein DI572_11525 [Staphylococcus epidermidis]
MFEYFSNHPTSKFKVLRKIIIKEYKGELMLTLFLPRFHRIL